MWRIVVLQYLLGNIPIFVGICVVLSAITEAAPNNPSLEVMLFGSGLVMIGTVMRMMLFLVRGMIRNQHTIINYLDPINPNVRR